MRRDWYIASGVMMTVLGVLPHDQYEKVEAGRTDILDGASLPGTGADEEKSKDRGRIR